MPLVAIVMGSKSDTELMQPALDILKGFGIEYEVSIISAHRTPEKAREYAKEAQGRGIEVIIAAAGGAAHLPGVLASWTTLPVIGVPLATSELKGHGCPLFHCPDARRYSGSLYGGGKLGS